MSHKVHPKIFRIKQNSDWLSRGFYGKNFPVSLEEDYVIRNFLEKCLKTCSVEKIEIDRLSNRVNIYIYSSRPGLIIGRGGEGIEKIKKSLLKILFKKLNWTQKEMVQKSKEINLEVKEVSNPWHSSQIVAQWVAQKLEKRTPYRRTLKQAIEKVIVSKNVKGVKVEVSGRLDGVSISRKEWLEKGRLPKQTIRADIDYATYIAVCTYGAIGIKVWIYKGEKFES